ncbi:MAG TPA: cobalamin-dependent protein [Thermoleophilia bacterium]|nr:cobalamin-dependent protein [Thermoleophilia bacterium]
MTDFETPDPPSLAGRIAALDEQGALDAVTMRIASGEDPLATIEECQVGMRWVGEHYESGKYFISGLIMAGEIFRQAMEALSPLLPEITVDQGQGTVLLCTVRGDIHDLGKNIVSMMLSSYGIVVHDLGVDVAPEEVVRMAIELQPDVLGLSGLLSVASEGMKATVSAVRNAHGRIGRQMPIIIGGGLVNEQTRLSTGADLWANDASRGVRLIRETMAASSG